MNRLTPLSELSPTLEEGNVVAWQFEPGMYVDQDAIVLNLDRTERAAKMFGLGGVIVKSYFGDQTSYNTTSEGVTGINADGSATGTASGSATRSKTEHTSLEEELLLLPSAYRWPIATININRNELASRISDRIQRGDTQNRAWAKEIDRSLRWGMIESGRDKIKKDFFSLRDFEPMGTSIISTLATFNIIDNASPAAIAIGLGFWHGVHTVGTAIANKRHTGHHQLEHKRWSIFPFGVQPDRFAAATGMIATNRLVKYSGGDE